MTVQLLILAGALAGLGATLVLSELLPTHPDLSDAVNRLRAPAAGRWPDQHGFAGEGGQHSKGWVDRLGGRIADEARGRRLVPLPARDLALLGRTPGGFLLTKLGLAGLGLAFPPVLATLMAIFGLGLPIVIPVLGSLALAGALFLLPDLDVRNRARESRRELRRAVCAYLDLVALERASDAGAAESMERAASISAGGSFGRIHDALLRARLDGAAPWTGLQALASDVDVPELADVADIMRLSGEDGAAIYDTLRARAHSLRTTILTEHEAQANADSEKMVAPVAFLGIVFIALLGYPAFARIVFG